MVVQLELNHDQYEALSRVAADTGLTPVEAAARAVSDFVQFRDPGDLEPAEVFPESDDFYYSAERYL